MYKDYLDFIMIKLSNILFNGSQSATKDEILDSIKRILNEYNENGGNIIITDFRNK